MNTHGRPLKIAIVGAGSVGFTRRLVRDFLSVPEFQAIKFAFQDISEPNLEMITMLCQKDIEANDVPATIEPTTDRKIALTHANYVINTARVGGLEAFKTDVEIPLRYGVDQCVGDTICAGGLMYGQRTIPMITELCKQISEYADPDAILLNYANPMAMNTWASMENSSVPTIGLCHGVQGGHHLLAGLLENFLNIGRREGDRISITKNDIDIVAAGINHQTWYLKVQYDGYDWAKELLPLFEADANVMENEKVRIDLIKRFGYFSTESNGHLSEYLPWYRKRTDEINEWISTNSWIHGETGGYLRVCTENRNWFESDFPSWIERDAWKFNPELRSDEHGSWIVEAIETGRAYRGHFNVRNNNVITNLPDDCIVEVPGYVDRNGLSIPIVGELPMGCAAICDNSVQVQRMAKDAALTGDVELLKQAVLLDPLVGAVCNPPEVCHMVDAMLIAQAEWLPQYTEQIKAARIRQTDESIQNHRSSSVAAWMEIRTVAATKLAHG